MKKQTLLVALAALGCVGVTGCYSGKVLEDPDFKWIVHGQHQLAQVDEEGKYLANGWNGKSNELYQAATMKASSLKEVSKLDKELAKTLKERNPERLYTIDVVLGMNDAGYSKKALTSDGKFIEGNGSFSLKVTKCTFDSVEEVYSEDTWISSKEAHTESLTPNNFFVTPNYAEAFDDYGFDWNTDTLCVGGAGKYTVVAAQYAKATSDGVIFGLGLVKVEDFAEQEGAQAYTELSAFIASEHTYNIVGKINGVDTWDTTDYPLVASADGKSYSAEITLAAGDSIKVRADNAWNNSWGKNGGSDNIAIEEAGTYVVTLSNIKAGGTANVTCVKKAA